MSLRDQLVAKGFASKKKAKQVDRELKNQRKQKQGKRRKKKVVQAEQHAAEADARAREHAARRKRRIAREEAKEQMERALRIRNLILGNRMRVGGKQPFWHHSLCRRFLFRRKLAPRVAEQLRAGQLAIVAHDLGTRVAYEVVPEATAALLSELAPQLVVFRVTADGRAGEAQFGFLHRDWETDLRPHRRRAAGPGQPHQ